MYYDKIVNTSNSVNNNALTDISLTKEFKNSGQYNPPSNLNLGNTFKQNIIYPLKHKEGDIIYQGRSGNSIRMGSENGEGIYPNFKIRNGQRVDINNTNPISIIEEDINKDKSSIWITSNEAINLSIASKKMDSLVKPPINFDGEQIILNSDRIILNSKINEILAYSNKDILLSANEEFGVNSKRTTIKSDNIYLGANTATEPIVLGHQLLILLYKILTQLAYLTVTTSAGVSSPPNNATEFTNIMKELNNILSRNNFTL